MSIHIDEVLEYLDRNLTCQRADGMPALMTALYDAFVDHGGSKDEVTAFSQGVLTGMLLMTEVNRLPDCRKSLGIRCHSEPARRLVWQSPK